MARLGHLAQPFSPAERRACQRAYVEHQGLVRLIGRQMLRSHPYLDKATIYSCVDVAFLKAFRAHDPEKGKFSTIFTKFAQGEINHWIRDHHGMIRLPREAQSLLAAARRLISQGHSLAEVTVLLDCHRDALLKVLSMSLTPGDKLYDPDRMCCERATPMERLEAEEV